MNWISPACSVGDSWESANADDATRSGVGMSTVSRSNGAYQPRDRDLTTSDGNLRIHRSANAGRTANPIAKNVSPVARNRESNLWCRSAWVLIDDGDSSLLRGDVCPRKSVAVQNGDRWLVAVTLVHRMRVEDTDAFARSHGIRDVHEAGARRNRRWWPIAARAADVQGIHANDIVPRSVALTRESGDEHGAAIGPHPPPGRDECPVIQTRRANRTHTRGCIPNRMHAHRRVGHESRTTFGVHRQAGVIRGRGHRQWIGPGDIVASAGCGRCERRQQQPPHDPDSLSVSRNVHCLSTAHGEF